MAERRYTPRNSNALRARSASNQRKSRQLSQRQHGLHFDRKKLGRSPCPVREWDIQPERDVGERHSRSDSDKAQIKELERENKEICTANEMLKEASASFVQAEHDRPVRR